MSTPWNPKLTPDQIDAIHGYTNDSMGVNSMLRGKFSPDPETLLTEDDYQEQHRLLSQAFHNTPIADVPMVLHRRIYMPAEWRGKPQETRVLRALDRAAKNRRTIRLPGYQSTTKYGKVLEPYTNLHNIRFIITAKHGIDVTRYSAVPREHEVLLPHNTYFRLDQFTPGKWSDEYRRGIPHTVHMTQVV